MAEFDDLEAVPAPEGELTLCLVASGQETNIHGDISAGWVVAQMEQAAELAAARRAQGRTATVAMQAMDFLCPVRVGATLSIHTQLEEVGRSSMTFTVEAWIQPPFETGPDSYYKVTESRFVMVALDEQGRIRAVPEEA